MQARPLFERPDKRINVLIVDASALFRAKMARTLGEAPGVAAIETARGPVEARAKLASFRPDVVVVDDVAKMRPELLRELAAKAIVATASDVAGAIGARPAAAPASAAARVIAVGASTGGTEATHLLLSMLPADMPGIVVVQHMPPGFTRSYAERLDRETAFAVKEAASGDPVLPGRVLIAPGECQMKLKRYGDGYRVDIFKGDRVSGHCPSVDVLFESVAQTAGSRSIGVLLTGMGSDGAKGLLSIRRQGGRTYGQDEATSVVYGMPKAALALGAVEKQLPIGRMAQALVAATRPGA
ncbi:chemotaxis protein CheB [Paenibacillus flagellatus]|uniref:protein-glutamate methylesterase n=1 Tax=Paenibacillus flagellatus TaxID=2211139 RepID=A0A2V5KAN0_9BACL|nr:chemotaxis protein CheB [Paenibacillus flagellatus]PYI56641.1 chemotaxis response regulator protein-glutamate methylesterase [Paenibacillus flagellatus]